MPTDKTVASDGDAATEAVAEREERGYVMAVTALMLIPMLVFTAFATDVGAWYVRAQEIQRAADAAALAAVVWMPDEDQAADIAYDAAARNGFRDQPGDFDDPNADLPQVQVSQVGTQRVRVDIRAEGDLYFGSVLESFEAPDITRFATAEYILPVPMGNPTSTLGTGNAPGGSGERLWLAVNGYCTGRQQGDHISGRYQGTSYTCDEGPDSSNHTVDNPQYDADGYYLVLDMPENSGYTTWDVQFYDPGTCHPGAEELGAGWSSGVDLETSLYAADDTPLDDYDNITVANRFGTRTFTDGECGWVTGYSIDASQPRGRWVLNYRSRAVTDEGRINYFGVRLNPAASGATFCSTVGGVNLDTCPQVSALEWLPVYVLNEDRFGNPMFAPGAAATFYLAEVDDVHAGKRLEITLFDPGEGMNNLQILAPDGSRLPFDYETIDNDPPALINRRYTGSGSNDWVNMTDLPLQGNDLCDSGTNNCLDVTSSRFQNRTVRLYVDIPLTYSCTTDCWWRIRYEPEGSGSVTDRTVWATRVTGDPVRLIE